MGKTGRRALNMMEVKKKHRAKNPKGVPIATFGSELRKKAAEF